MREPVNPRLPLPGIRWRGFTLQLFVLTILPLSILVVGAVLISQSLHHQAMVDLVGDRNLRAVRIAGDGISRQLDRKVNQLNTAGRMIEGGLALDGDDRAFSLISAEFDGGMGLFEPAGFLTASTSMGDYWSDFPSSQPEFWRQVQAGQPGQVILAAAQDFPGGTQELAGVRLADERILVAGFAPAPLIQQTVSPLLAGDQSYMLVLTTTEVVLYFSGDPAALEDAVSQSGVGEALNGESGVNIISGTHGDMVTAFSTIAPAGWAIILTENWEEIATPFLNTTQSAPMLLIPLLLLAMIALFFGARQIVQPLQELEVRTNRMARGDFKAIQESVGGIDEIKHLQNVLAETAGDLYSAREALRGYIGAINDGVEKERRGLARELHDDTLQALIALNQRLQLAREMADTPEERSSLDELQQMTANTIANLRRLVRGLRPIYLEDLGLTAALEMLAKETAALNQRQIHYSVKGEERRLAADLELALYRMAQEALSNAERHSQAANIWLEVDYAQDEVRLLVRDDGVGFLLPEMPDQFARQGHFGLLGLTERAELIGAELQVWSQPGQGTRVEVRVPVGRQEVK